MPPLHAPRRRHPRPRRPSTALVRAGAYRARHPRRRPAEPRSGGDASLRRLRRQRRRHAEPARGHPPPRARGRVHPVTTNKVYGDGPNRVPLVELETRWDYADPAYAHGIDETMSHRPLHALAVRRVQGRRRRARAGVRALLRHDDRHLPRRLPHRPAPLGRRAARLPQLPRAHRAPRGPVHDLRLQGEAGPRPDPLRRRHQRVLGVRARTRGRARSTTSAAARTTPPACSSAST